MSVPSFSILASNVTVGNEGVPTHSFLTSAGGTIQLKRTDGVPELLDVQGNVQASFVLGNGALLTGIVTANASYLSEGTLSQSVFPQTVGNSATAYIGNGYGLDHLHGANITGPVEASLLTGTISQNRLPTTIGNASTLFVGDGGQLANTQPTISGAASTILQANLSSSKAVVSDALGKVAVANTTAQEIEYLRGVTSNVQQQLNAIGTSITGAATTIVTSNLTASRVVISTADGKIGVGNATSQDLEYIQGLSANVQTQLNAKEPLITLTASRAVVSNSTGKLETVATTSAELAYLNGTTSSVQGQLDTKFPRNVNSWLTSTEGTNRLKFDSTNKTSFGTGNGYEWQNGAANTAIMTLSDTGNLSATQFTGNGYALTQTNAANVTGQLDADLVLVSGTIDADLVITSGTLTQALFPTTLGNAMTTFVGNNAVLAGHGISRGANVTLATNLAVGNGALSNVLLSGAENTAIGHTALAKNTTGITNTAVGVNALPKNSTGSYNTAVGYAALRDSSTATFNSAFGLSAMTLNTTGTVNTACGAQALLNNTTGSGSTAVGTNALYASTGSWNTAVGYQAAYNVSTGNYNSALGHNALYYNISGTGFNYGVCSGLGYDARASSDYQICLGGSGTTTYVYGTVQNRSDMRDKTDVRNITLGLEFIEKLRPVDYKWDMRDDYFDKKQAINKITLCTTLSANAEVGVYDIVCETVKVGELTVPTGDIATTGSHCPAADAVLTCPSLSALEFSYTTAEILDPVPKDGSRSRSRYHHGLIAQEVKDVLEDLGTDFGGFQWHAHNGTGDDVYTIGYDELIAPLIKSVQELSEQLRDVRAENEALKSRLAAGGL